jgi:hypothetical protein
LACGFDGLWDLKFGTSVAPEGARRSDQRIERSQRIAEGIDMERISPLQRNADTAVMLLESPTQRVTNPVTRCLDWAEDHWEAVGMTASLLAALVLATILAVGFNVVSTQLDRHEAAGAGAPSASSTRS